MSELFNENAKHGEYGQTVSAYEFRYSHEKHSLHHFPELLNVLEHGWEIKYNNFHKYFDFKQGNRFTDAEPFLSYKEVVRTAYNCFSSNHNLAVRIKPTQKTLEVVTKPLWTNENFVELRTRCNHEIRDFLGMNHHGHGIPPVDVKKNMYYNPQQFRETKEGDNYGLFRGHDFEQSFHEQEVESK